MSRTYTIIVPATDWTAPVSVAFDLGRAAHALGWDVRVLYLSEGGRRADGDFATEIRKFRFSDIFRLRGWVHTHCLRPDLVGGLIGLNPRCTVVTTVHNFFLKDLSFGYPRHKVLLSWCLWKAALARFDRVVTISTPQRRYYRRLMPGIRFDQVYNTRSQPQERGAPAPAIGAWIAAQRGAGRTVLAYVGRLTAGKNVAGLLDALPAVPGVALLLCGDGPERPGLESRSAGAGLADRVLFAGHVDRPTDALALADALVLPSFSEGFPLVVLEAAAVGVPCLLSRIAVHRELARIGFGATFDHRDFSDFSTTLQQLLRDMPAPCARLRQLWEHDFTPAAGFARYEAIVSSIR